MRRLTSRILGLECYALLLTFVQMLGGVRTDEAKYLLSIPYPHPPFLRWMMSLFAAMPAQEFFWRLFIASMLVQATWLLIDLGYVLSPVRRMTLVFSWLFSAAFILQTGSVMLAPVTALFGLFFVWLSLRPHPVGRRAVPLVACAWFLGLFTAYQTVLYLPILVYVFRSAHVSWRKIFLFAGFPLVLLGLYTLTNPFAIASMMNAGTQDAPLLWSVRMTNVLRIALLAGSGCTTIAGLYGVLTAGRRDLILSLGLLLAFIALTSQQYYAILLTPVLLAGLMSLLLRRRIIGGFFLPMQIIVTALLVFVYFPVTHSTNARETMRVLQKEGVAGLVLIDGPFGHEWQYESGNPIGRFTQTLSSSVEKSAAAIVCTKKTCEEDLGEEWVRLQGTPVEVWVKKSE